MWALLVVMLAVALIAQTRSKSRIQRELGYRESEAAYLQDLLFEEKVKSNRLKGEVKKYNALGEGDPFRTLTLPLEQPRPRTLPAGTEPPPEAESSLEAQEERRKALRLLTERWEDTNQKFGELTQLYSDAVVGVRPSEDLGHFLSLMENVRTEFDQISQALEEATRPGRDSAVEGVAPTPVVSGDGLDL